MSAPSLERMPTGYSLLADITAAELEKNKGSNGNSVQRSEKEVSVVSRFPLDGIASYVSSDRTPVEFHKKAQKLTVGDQKLTVGDIEIRKQNFIDFLKKNFDLLGYNGDREKASDYSYIEAQKLVDGKGK